MTAQNVSVGDGSLSSVVSAINRADVGVSANALQVGHERIRAGGVVQNARAPTARRPSTRRPSRARHSVRWRPRRRPRTPSCRWAGRWLSGHLADQHGHRVAARGDRRPRPGERLTGHPHRGSGRIPGGRVRCPHWSARPTRSCPPSRPTPPTTQSTNTAGAAQRADLAQRRWPSRCCPSSDGPSASSGAGSDGTAGEVRRAGHHLLGHHHLQPERLRGGLRREPGRRAGHVHRGRDLLGRRTRPTPDRSASPVRRNNTVPGSYAVSISQSAAQAVDTGSTTFAASTSTVGVGGELHHHVGIEHRHLRHRRPGRASPT